MELDLKGRGIVITGGGSGIGAAVARAVLEEGARVTILDLADAEGIAGGTSAHFVKCDVTDAPDVERAMREASDRLGRLDGVVANAGINGMQAPIEDLTPSEWRQTLSVCLDGVFYTIRSAIPHMTGDGGSIVITSSITGTRSFATEGAAAYAAAKAGIVALAKLAAVELGRYGIRVNAIAPGGVLDTRLWDERTMLRNLDELAHVRLIDAPLVGAGTSSRDVAELILFLLSSSSRRISGALIHIDAAQSLLGGGILRDAKREPFPPPKGVRNREGGLP